MSRELGGSDALVRCVLQRLGDALEAADATATAARFAWPAADDRRIDHDWRILDDALTSDEPAELGPLAQRLVRARSFGFMGS